MIKPIKRYRPERHYMRGPGPKWLEKHRGAVDLVDAVMDNYGSDTSARKLLLPACAALAQLSLAGHVVGVAGGCGANLIGDASAIICRPPTAPEIRDRLPSRSGITARRAIVTTA